MGYLIFVLSLAVLVGLIQSIFIRVRRSRRRNVARDMVPVEAALRILRDEFTVGVPAHRDIKQGEEITVHLLPSLPHEVLDKWKSKLNPPPVQNVRAIGVRPVKKNQPVTLRIVGGTKANPDFHVEVPAVGRVTVEWTSTEPVNKLIRVDVIIDDIRVQTSVQFTDNVLEAIEDSLTEYFGA